MTRTPESEQLGRTNHLRLVQGFAANEREHVRPVADNERRSMTKFVKHALYVQVYRFLAQQISKGAWGPGAPLPDEQELARQLGLSPGTIRMALDKLEADQLVVRRQGGGTFVGRGQTR
jgi:DNA-binding transcriptional ArsR family regulator